ncbi:WXG100 family type VII secretion target [Planosporangium mesophilum]|uniref:WXG100 family type VII secretion target n=1 Tax=Planosporangium mesophilum TaxID=689768 RepID=A0A8J3X1T5_9ACTN|nr:WXG100 family type VII secretion target [Planosporangium mesophilum]NJC85776.1 WXG100 family type VII secretion target [Planosporangium mesophilum]GII24757.1 hypothetical protein Pme01_43540 [Planosporangium mesophilum]
MSGEQHANKLESWFSSLPSLVQEVLHEPFDWANGCLKSVAGNPDALMAAAGQYVQIAESVHLVGQQQVQARAALAGQWRGDAYDAFTEKMQHVEEQLAKLAEAIKPVKEVLESGAQACVESANMIIDLVTSLIMFALGTIAVNVALAVISLGTSLAAGVAAVVAKAVDTLAKVARVVEKLAQVLAKVAEIFRKLSQLLKTISQVVKQLLEVLKDGKALAKTAKGWDKLGAMTSSSIQYAATSKGISAATGGTVNIPGGGGKLYATGKDYVEGWQDASDAQDHAQR